MKDINDVSLPDDIYYAESHEWAKTEGDHVKVGISDYAQDQLGDIVFVEMPEVGETFDKGAEFGTVESVKAVSELYMPVGGEIMAVNGALEDAPELLNQDPKRWRPWLDEMLINFGLRVRRWQLGGTRFPDAFWKPDR